MNLHSSAWTGRAARSLEEAFGPSVRSSYAHIVPMAGPVDTSRNWSLYAVAVVVMTALIATSYLLDGTPTETDAAQASALDLQDAQLAAVAAKD